MCTLSDVSSPLLCPWTSIPIWQTDGEEAGKFKRKLQPDKLPTLNQSKSNCLHSTFQHLTEIIAGSERDVKTNNLLHLLLLYYRNSEREVKRAHVCLIIDGHRELSRWESRQEEWVFSPQLE